MFWKSFSKSQQQKPYKTIEEYYEIIKELLTAIMYCDGYKTLSHKKLIEYFTSNYEQLDDTEAKLVDILRRHRNSILYYGKKLTVEFLTNNEEEIKIVVSKLMKLSKEKSENS